MIENLKPSRPKRHDAIESIRKGIEKSLKPNIDKITKDANNNGDKTTNNKQIKSISLPIKETTSNRKSGFPSFLYYRKSIVIK